MTYNIQDERTEREKAATWGFIVCTSDFGDYRTHIARPLKEENESRVIMDVMRKRDDFKRVRHVRGRETKEGLTYRPRLGANERVYIHNFNSFLPQKECVHVGPRVSYYPIRGDIEVSKELRHGVTEVVIGGDSGGRALALDEWIVSELLPNKDLHQRDDQWRAWVIGEDYIRRVLDVLDLEDQANPRHDALVMMREYQRESVDYFTRGENSKVLDIEAIIDLNHAVQGVLLTLTS